MKLTFEPVQAVGYIIEAAFNVDIYDYTVATATTIYHLIGPTPMDYTFSSSISHTQGLTAAQ